MYRSLVHVERLSEQLQPQLDRVIPRLFAPGDERRIQGIIGRVRGLDRTEVLELLKGIETHFHGKHPELERTAHGNYERMKHFVRNESLLTDEQRLLIGAYFTMEYAIESAALFNPSMVPAIDQSRVPEGAIRFLMSLRAVGEGHISSIVFRQGLIHEDGRITVRPPSRFSRQLEVAEDRAYRRPIYRQKLIEMGVHNPAAEEILRRLPEEFTFDNLNRAIEEVTEEWDEPFALHETAENLRSLARANYLLRLPKGADPSEFVIFPHSANESHGLEDIRLVLFRHDDGRECYYGVYTAYNGSRIVPQLLESTGEDTIKIHTLGGRFVQNKGMALFPRQVNGEYLMIGRLDNENLFLMRSDNVLFWNQAELLQTPRYSWELVQIGNCGSPLETEAGWLLLTHGVGPMRQYCIGASLFDLHDPSRLIGRLAEPLLVPTGDERVGYVPNVVYSCGGMIHNGKLVIPYGISDRAATFAVVSLAELLDVLRS